MPMARKTRNTGTPRRPDTRLTRIATVISAPVTTKRLAVVNGSARCTADTRSPTQDSRRAPSADAAATPQAPRGGRAQRAEVSEVN